MKTTQKSRKDSKESTSSTKKPSSGKELKDHKHKYNTPVAGEDGSTEDQSGGKSKKTVKTTEKSKSPTQGKNPGEKSKF